MSGLSKVEVQGVTKAFGDGEGMVPALEQITFQVPGGGFTSLLGPSGCGKSTLFNIIAGLMRPDCGDVLLDGRSVIGKPGQVGYMLQKDLLLPWRSIQDNIILGARLRHVPRKTPCSKPGRSWSATASRALKNANPMNFPAVCASAPRCCARC